MALGSLLLTVTISGATDRNPILGLDESQTQAQDGRAYFGTDTGGNDGGGLVTEFDSVVPDPGSLVLVLTGLALLACGRLSVFAGGLESARPAAVAEQWNRITTQK